MSRMSQMIGVRIASPVLYVESDHDNKFHVYDKATGKLLWEAVLPVGGNARSATYEVHGR